MDIVSNEESFETWLQNFTSLATLYDTTFLEFWRPCSRERLRTNPDTRILARH